MSDKLNKLKKKQINKPIIKIDTYNEEEIFKWIFSLLFSLITFGFIGFIISNIYHADINKLIEEGNSVSFLGQIRPEPLEALLVRMGIIVLPLLLMLYYIFFSRTEIIKKITTKNSLLFIGVAVFIAIIVLIYKDFSALNPFNPDTGEQAQHIRDMEGKTNFGFYFKNLFLEKNLFFYSAICVPVIFGVFLLGFKKYKWEDSSRFKSIVPISVYILLGILILCIVAMNVFSFPYTYENKYDFNAIYYSMTQVYSGVPMLIDSFTNTYGLYPQLLNPIFQVIGLSVFNFSFVMAILLGLSFLFIVIFLKRHTSNIIIVFLGILSLINFSYLNFRFTTPFDCSFAFFPIRFIIPSTLLFLSSLYLIKKSKIIYWITFFVMGTFILWNPEIGMVSFIAWIVVNCYNDFYSQENKIEFKKIITHIFVAIVVLALVFTLYYIVVYINYGQFPEIKKLFNFILVFGKYGFGALPMKLIHPWNIAALIYLIGILYSIVKWYNKAITTKSSVILLTSIIGIGFFIYFQGRSHNFTFATSICFCFVLMTLLTDELWQLIRTKNILFLNLVFLVFLYLTSFSFFEIISNTKKINELVYQKDDKAKQKDEELKIKNNENFIVNNTLPLEKVYVFTARELEGLYFNGNKIPSAFNPGLLDITFNSDLKRLERRLRDSSYKIFIEPEKFNLPFMQRSLATVAARYQVHKNNNSMFLLKPNKNKIIETSFFNTGEASAFYRKYKSDTLGINTRINDALGVNPINLPAEFSVQILFNSKPQLYPFATLIGNADETSGFMICNNLGTEKYYFGINGKTYLLPVISNAWAYLTINVYASKVEIFQNGVLLYTLPMETPYKNSKQNLFIGNMGFLRNYFGEIAEIDISKKILLPDEVKTTWKKIESQLNK